MPRLVALALVAFAGCDPAPTPKPVHPGEDDTGCGAVTWYRDDDGDGVGDAARGSASSCEPLPGYAAVDGDCDDLDAAVFPGAPERCDGRDQDCDGAVDEEPIDLATWYADADGDGFGSPAEATTTCEAPPGHVADGADCDDTDADVFPGAWELCGGEEARDEDCDGEVDEGDAANADTWYADLDGDGFGDAGASVRACERPEGYASGPGDCDDADPAVSPAADEVCGGADEDCDGTVDGPDAIDAPTWYADLDADGFGDPAAVTVACEAPAAHVSDATDCDDTDPAVAPAAFEVCGGDDEDCDGAVDEPDAIDAPTWHADRDGDTFGDPLLPTVACEAPAAHVADATDCDDTDAAVSPGAPERCGGGDEDCDGTVDEPDASDAISWHADTDGDGFGDASTGVRACDAPEGRIADATDCDDTDATVSPAALEYCGDDDEDCDGEVDEDDAADAWTWHRDADLDGFGDPALTTVACEWPFGYTTYGTDCDDTDGEVRPWGGETCETPYDDDCDGVTNEIGGLYCTGFYADGDADGFGTGDSLCSCEPQGVFTTEVDGDCNDTDPDTWPSAPEAWDGIDQSCGGDGDDALLADEGVALLGRYAYDYTGRYVGSAGDRDGDGLPELLVSAPYADVGGVVYVLHTPPEADTSLVENDLALVGEVDGWTGRSAGAGDLDGDGLDDLVIGASRAADGGAAYVIRGRLEGSFDLADAPLVLYGHEWADLGAWVGFLGDLDGDGKDELGVGQPGPTDGDGALLLFSDPGDGVFDPADMPALSFDDGELAYRAEVGTEAAALGDVDGDGLDDIAVSARGYSGDDIQYRGAVYVLYGPPTMGDLEVVADARLDGLGSTDWAGSSLSPAGDIDADGYRDLLVGAPGADRTGEVYLVTRVDSVPLSLSHTTYVGVYDAGDAVAGGGDLDGDGVPDVVIGESYNRLLDNAGTVHVLLHSPAGTVDLADADVILQGRAASLAGNAVSIVGDADGDGLDDLLVGAFADTTVGTSAGVAWFVPGR